MDRIATRSALLLWLLFVTSPAVTKADSLPKNGLVCWLDAADVLADGGNRPVTLDTKLAAWRDKSGLGNHLEQPDVARQPTLVQGDWCSLPVVRFQSSSLQRAVLRGFRSGEQPFQVFAVIRASTEADKTPRLLDLRTLVSNPNKPKQYTLKRTGFWLGCDAFPGTEGKLRLSVWTGDQGLARPTTWDNQPHIVEADYHGNQRWSLYHDGVLAGRGRYSGDRTFLGYDGGARIALGQLYDGTDAATFLQGEVAELLIYNRPLSFDEQQTVGAYLQAKYTVPAQYRSQPPASPDFERDILPLLKNQCLDCHGLHEPEAGLDLSTLTSILRGGTSGPGIQPGNAASSLLLHMVATNEMPPETSLSDQEVELLRLWIDRLKVEQVAGSSRSQATSTHWAFAKLQPPSVPDADAGGNPVDQFIVRRLRRHKLKHASAADRKTLVRRAYLDLWGLIPSTNEVARFVADERPDAWERLLAELMNSPHFGEKWGRHWLDNVAYTDTLALDNDQLIMKVGPGKHKYRDYVVRSFNEDKPFRRFLIEQLAGDELVDWRNQDRLDERSRELLVATGMLRCSADFTDENELNTLGERFGVLHRTIESLGVNLLGLTVQCSKCHDHKYEPITQRDYYRFSAILAPALNPNHWLQPADRQLPGLGPAEQAEIDAAIQAAQQRQQKIEGAVRQRLLTEQLAQLPAEIRADVEGAWKTPADKRNEVQQYFADKFANRLTIKDEAVNAALLPEEKQAHERAAVEVGKARGQIQSAIIQAVYDTSPPLPVYVHRRGNHETPGAEVQPGVFAVLDAHYENPRLAALGQSSGRRLKLAHTLTDWQTPAGALVARVRVNRIWQQLFGKGLVETSANFGVSGMPPSHPELLEFLAAQFVKTDGQLKPLLQLLMSSETYCQSSTVPEAQAASSSQVDPDNRLLWRQRLRRLHAEIVRDTILAASGRLDRTVGGPPVGIVNRPDGMVVEANDENIAPDKKWRRSMYVLQRRNYHLSVLAAFDQPVLTENCTQRENSAVVTQSLLMLNDRFILRQAAALADEILASKSKTREEQVDTAFQRLLCRSPHQKEQMWCLEAYTENFNRFTEQKLASADASRKALTQICHMLLNTSELLYNH